MRYKDNLNTKNIMLLLNFSKIGIRSINYRFSKALSTYYTDSHEWVKISDNNKRATIGITDFAQESMGDIVFCDLEDVGGNFKKGDIFGILESVKASSDIHMPISGDIIEINEDVEKNSSLVNEFPLDNGWLIKINIENKDDLATLLTETEYIKLCRDS